METHKSSDMEAPCGLQAKPQYQDLCHTTDSSKFFYEIAYFDRTLCEDSATKLHRSSAERLAPRCAGSRGSKSTSSCKSGTLATPESCTVRETSRRRELATDLAWEGTAELAGSSRSPSVWKDSTPGASPSSQALADDRDQTRSNMLM